MKTAIITGASAGLGAEFVRQLEDQFPGIECLWVIARRRERLEEITVRYGKRFSVCVLPLDLCNASDLASLESELARQKPDVRLLINNAGCGYLGNLGESDTASQKRMADLNVSALTAVTNMVIPYIGRGGHIINVSSIASFCPNPRMTAYSSTKAYVSSFTRGLSEELKGKGIGVTAVCPGPMDTEFLDLGGISGNSKTFDVLPHCDPVKVVAGVYAAAKAGKVFYTPTAFYKFYRVLAKILPQGLMIKFTKT